MFLSEDEADGRTERLRVAKKERKDEFSGRKWRPQEQTLTHVLLHIYVLVLTV